MTQRKRLPTARTKRQSLSWYQRHPERARELCRNYRHRNKEKCAASGRAWRQRNKEKVRAAERRRYAKNPRSARYERKRAWRQSAVGKLRASQNAKIRYYSDPNYRIKAILRVRFYQALKARGAVCRVKNNELIGCSIEELWGKLVLQFKPGMTVENYGAVWEIDHKKACARFNLITLSEQLACFHWSNLQPLFIKENRSKAAK